ncbi:MAG TPA: DUF1801 domain-containing protein [Gemmatimonadaceae bacterium]|nr:DUF1801 domain-containing protein [Gemmatimonadaceae bacterium]
MPARDTGKTAKPTVGKPAKRTAATELPETDASIDEYIASRASEEQKVDCKRLMSMLERVTKEKPKMWGPSIVGYGTYKYTYESGRTGEMCRVGFAIRGRELVVYVLAEGTEQEALLARLGKHRMGKSCLYIKRLADVDFGVLEKLVVGSLAQLKARYG